jgi:hypothetical protein
MELACSDALLVRAHSGSQRRSTPGSRMNVVKHGALRLYFRV